MTNSWAVTRDNLGLQAMAYAAPGAYGAAYPAHGYVQQQQQQHADPQAAAYAQYMQQVCSRGGAGGGDVPHA